MMRRPYHTAWAPAFRRALSGSFLFSFCATASVLVTPKPLGVRARRPPLCRNSYSGAYVAGPGIGTPRGRRSLLRKSRARGRRGIYRAPPGRSQSEYAPRFARNFLFQARPPRRRSFAVHIAAFCGFGGFVGLGPLPARRWFSGAVVSLVLVSPVGVECWFWLRRFR